ncbi:MAG: ParB N-terminal domain-containing protein [Treponema sp.]|nr:ParB N-terminal domain-containing protein [Treponema sp.]
MLDDARYRGTEDSRSVPVLVKDIPIEEIVIKRNIRREYEGIGELKASIRQYGLLQPVTVYKEGESYVIKTGHRRFLAYRALHDESPEQFHHIRCIISDAGNIPTIQLIENVQRVDLNQRELFTALVALKEQGLTIKQIAEIMGKSESYVKFIFIGVNEIKRDPELQAFIMSPGGTIQDIVETKGIGDRDERRSLLEQRKEGTLTRAGLRKKAKVLKTESNAVTSIAGNTSEERKVYTVHLQINTDQRNILISFEHDLPFKRILAEIKGFIAREHIVCKDLEMLNV